jgi:cell division septation protein DedD
MTTFGQFVLPLTVVMALALLFFSVKLFFFNPNDVSIHAGGSAVSEQNTPSHETIKKPVVKSDQIQVKTAITKPVVSVTVKTATAKPVDDEQKNVSAAAADKNAAVKETVKPQPVKKEQAKPEPAAVKETVKPQPVKKEQVKSQPAAVKEPSKTQPSAVKETGKPQQGSAAEPAKPENAVKTADKYTAKAAGARWDVQIGGFASRDNAALLLEKARAKGHDVYISESTLNGNTFYRVRVKGDKTREETQKLSLTLQDEGYPVYLVEIK